MEKRRDTEKMRYRAKKRYMSSAFWKRRWISSVKCYVCTNTCEENETCENNVARSKVDNHTDTTCFGWCIILVKFVI